MYNPRFSPKKSCLGDPALFYPEFPSHLLRYEKLIFPQFRTQIITVLPTTSVSTFSRLCGHYASCDLCVGTMTCVPSVWALCLAFPSVPYMWELCLALPSAHCMWALCLALCALCGHYVMLVCLVWALSLALCALCGNYSLLCMGTKPCLVYLVWEP